MNSYKKLIGAVSLIAFASIASSAKWSFDAVYTPVRTQFIKSCEKNNIDFISGFKLFLFQGVEGFKRFSGIEIDSKLIEQKFLTKYQL